MLIKFPSLARVNTRHRRSPALPPSRGRLYAHRVKIIHAGDLSPSLTRK